MRNKIGVFNFSVDLSVYVPRTYFDPIPGVFLFCSVVPLGVRVGPVQPVVHVEFIVH